MMLCSKIVISIFTSFIIIIVNQKKLNVLSQSGEVGREIVYNIKLRPRPRITIVGQGPTAPAVGAGGVLFGHFSLIYHFLSLKGGPI